VGRDLAIISYDGSPEAASADPPLTTYAVDTRAAGRALAEMLISRIRGRAPEELRRVVARAPDPAGIRRRFTVVPEPPQQAATGAAPTTLA
jgi:hypothetical protein